MKNVVGNKLQVVVKNITTVADNIKQFHFSSRDESELPVFAGGAHVVVDMADGDSLRRNPYSLMGNINDRSSYSISVLHLKDGRGGSHYMHSQVKEGMEMTISYPINLFPLDWHARKHLLIAGGIGITPIMAQAQALMNNMIPFEIYYIVRSEKRAAHLSDLSRLYGHRFHFHDDKATASRFNPSSLISNQPIGTHVYICGPPSLMDTVVSLCEKSGWARESIHTERFLAPLSGKPYTVELAQSQKILTVRKNQSMLEAIEQAGVNPPYLCRGGACGQCETNVISFSGKLSHHDHFLSHEEKNSGKKIMPCVSRVDGDNPHIVLKR